jgi:hypothetical protein
VSLGARERQRLCIQRNKNERDNEHKKYTYINIHI